MNNNEYDAREREFDYGELIDRCVAAGIPVLKKNGDSYAVSTLLKKLRETPEQRGGAIAAQVNGNGNGNVKSSRTAVRGSSGSRGGNKSKTDSRLASAILDDPLIKAYLAKKGVKKVHANTTVPLGVVMAVFGNHVDLGESGLGARLPNFLESEELKKYWQEKGVVQVTPHTELPVRFIYLLDA